MSPNEHDVYDLILVDAAECLAGSIRRMNGVHNTLTRNASPAALLAAGHLAEAIKAARRAADALTDDGPEKEVAR